MGKVLSILSRPIINFNVENRAHRAISKEKRSAAPKHRATVIELESILREHPEIVDELSKKDPLHNSRLKNVYVSASEKPVEIEKPLSSRYNPEKPFPLSRAVPKDFEYGMKEPDVCQPGYVTLRNVVKFISDHQTDPKLYNIEMIANQYKLEPEKVSDIIKFYGTFEIYVPVKSDSKAEKKPIRAKPSKVLELIEEDMRDENNKKEDEDAKEKNEKKEGHR